ncbi:hypothetical protein V9T40_009290 [Parthenolecanium corni]|uniref:Uncharacterized protein n=1 Tax=Parthenolecanium corni TaxID=536013 RepID=A0AAN9Y806_9HEMI
MESYYPQWPRMSIYPQQQQYSRVQEHESRPSRPRKSPHKKYSIPQRPRKISDSTITEEDIDKTYTGLDREIAEEFISVAMEPKRH